MYVHNVSGKHERTTQEVSVSSTTEDYLKNIYSASEKSGVSLVKPGELASLMQVTPGTVTSMMKSLSEEKLVEYLPRSGVKLTPRGRELALKMVRRHRLIELFLVEVLGLEWQLVHDEAEILEHAFSDRLIERIDEILGHPSTDPHGDPIPAADGNISSQDGMPLSALNTQERARIMRVNHDSREFLEFLGERGLFPGTEITIREKNSVSGTMVLVHENQETTLSMGMASLLTVLRI